MRTGMQGRLPWIRTARIQGTVPMMKGMVTAKATGTARGARAVDHAAQRRAPRPSVPNQCAADGN